MSVSEMSQQGEPRGTLKVTAPVGVTIEIADGTFTPLYSGTGGVELSLLPGLYSITWSAGGNSEDRLAPVLVGQETSLEGGRFAIDSATPSLLGEANDLEKVQYERASSVLDRATAKDDEVEQARSEIIVFTRSDIPSDGIAGSVRLMDASGGEMKASPKGINPLEGVSDALDVRSFCASAGTYLLRFRTVDQREVEQTVYLFEGRRTIAFLKYTSKMIAGGVGEKSQFVSSRGIDPVASTFVSIPLGAKKLNLDEVTRPADILLHKLAVGEPLLDTRLVEAVAQGDADPFLKLYAAALALDLRAIWRLKERSTKKLLGVYSGAFDDSEDGAVSVARAILSSFPLTPVNPDLQCIHWRLGVGQSASEHDDATLQAPPMLDTCWRWASAHSFDKAIGVEGNAGLVAASRNTQSSAPWLVWNADAGDKPAEAKMSEPLDLWNSVEQLVRTANSKYASADPQGSSVGAGAPLIANLSNATVEILNAAATVVETVNSADPDLLTRRLAFLTGTPKALMGDLVASAQNELSPLDAL
jgi:hypothetical protein